ncbi:hypothetical protein [Roseomonas sp. CECT 9278]|uniref:hypothetical protein n=1 Tax=Roseomonas sp. CECT 9278 TaxID=2845823 RepID=UPI001E4F9979|nr:hypothetical protein [Roseomonas sp. CECT 9278]CAH0198655.1 hypothetical protein ROS9278_01867 [Roseomonas sp. CECT 9278]
MPAQTDPLPEETPMFRILAMPVKVKTPHGWRFARFAIEPRQQGEPWWVVYRDDGGSWFTAMMPGEAA